MNSAFGFPRYYFSFPHFHMLWEYLKRRGFSRRMQRGEDDDLAAFIQNRIFLSHFLKIYFFFSFFYKNILYKFTMLFCYIKCCCITAQKKKMEKAFADVIIKWTSYIKPLVYFSMGF